MQTETEVQREARAATLASEERDRLIREAKEQGRREQLVDSRLDHHERRLDAINGNIRRGAEAQEAHTREIHGLRDLIVTESKVEEAVAAATTKALERQISRRQFTIAIVSLGLLLLGVIISLLVLLTQ